MELSMLFRAIPITTLAVITSLLSACGSYQNNDLNTNKKETEKVVTTQIYQSQDQLPIRSDLITYQLDNGLDILLLPRSKSGVELRLLVNSGSLHETEQQLGLAHFVEHMAFKGTRNFPDKQSFLALESQGLTLGSHINASTSFNSTIYRLSLPDNSNTELALNVLSDWASEISFDNDAFDAEREVIVEEWRLHQGSAYRINNELETLRYQGSRFAHRNTIGDINIIRNAPVSQAKAYYKRWYQPQRMTLVVTGNFDQTDIKKQINDYFANKPTGNTPADPNSWHQFKHNSQLESKLIFDPERAGRMLQLTLQNDLPSALNTTNGQWRDLIESTWIAVLNQRLDILTDHDKIKFARMNSKSSLLDANRVQALLIAKPKGDDYADTFAILTRELQRLATEPVTQAELDNVADIYIAKLSRQAANEQAYENSYLADRLVNSVSNHMPMLNKQQELAMAIQWLEALTPEHLQASVIETLTNSAPKIAIIGPDIDKGKITASELAHIWQQARQSVPGPFTLAAKTQDLLITAPDAIKTTQALNTKTILLNQTGKNKALTEQLTLENNMTVVIHSDSNLQGDVQFDLKIKGGNSLASNKQLGSVNWALNLAERCGYGGYSARQLAKFSRKEDLLVNAYSQQLYHGFRGKAPADNMDKLLSLIYLKLSSPNSCTDKLVNMQESYYLGQTKLPAERKFYNALTAASFNQSQRLVSSASGPWKKFTSQQLQTLYQQLFSHPEQMQLTISGPVDIKQLKPLLSQWLGNIVTVPETTDHAIDTSEKQEQQGWLDHNIKPLNQAMQQTFAIGSSPKAMVQIHYSADTPWTLQRQLGLQLIDDMTNLRLRNKVRGEASGVYVINMSQLLAKYPSAYYFARLNFTSAPERAGELAQLANKEIQKIARKGFSFAELKQAKKTWLLAQHQREKYSSYWLQALSQRTIEDGITNLNELTQLNVIVSEMSIETINEIAHELMGHAQKTFILMPKPLPMV